MEEFLEEMKDECQNENECDGMYNVLEETNEKMRFGGNVRNVVMNGWHLLIIDMDMVMDVEIVII